MSTTLTSAIVGLIEAGQAGHWDDEIGCDPVLDKAIENGVSALEESLGTPSKEREALAGLLYARSPVYVQAWDGAVEYAKQVLGL